MTAFWTALMLMSQLGLNLLLLAWISGVERDVKELKGKVEGLQAGAVIHNVHFHREAGR